MLGCAHFSGFIHRFSGTTQSWIHFNRVAMITLFETIAQATRPRKIIPVKVNICDFCLEKTITEMHDYEGFKICHKCNKNYVK